MFGVHEYVLDMATDFKDSLENDNLGFQVRDKEVGNMWKWVLRSLL